MKKEKIVPLYQQIKEDIKSAIESGKYKQQELIPSETELSNEYSVSRITVRRAIEELSNDGYLVKKQGLGTFVSTPRIHRKMISGTKVESFTDTCKSYGKKSSAKLLSRQIVPMRADEQDFFKGDSSGLLIYIERLRLADGLPIFLENQLLPYEEYKHLLDIDLNDASLYDEIKKISGKKVYSTTKLTLEATKASTSQSKKMSVQVGEPLLHLCSHFLDQDGNPLCIGRHYYIGSRYMYELG